jgi:hypothetical protein
MSTPGSTFNVSNQYTYENIEVRIVNIYSYVLIHRQYPNDRSACLPGVRDKLAEQQTDRIERSHNIVKNLKNENGGIKYNAGKP